MLQSIQLQNWKNFSEKTCSFDDCDLIIGHNGAGKTGILQALYFWQHLHIPNDSIHWKQLVSDGQDHANITIQLRNKPPVRVFCDLEKRSVKVFIGEKSVTRKVYREYFPYQALYVDSMSLNTLYLTPSLRRWFLDEILEISHETFRDSKKNYQKILTQRNKLLKAIKDGKSTPDELGYWNDLLVGFAQEIYSARNELILAIQSSEIFQATLDQKYQLNFFYASKLDVYESISTQMQDYFSENVQKEILLARTLRGPHLDDWSIRIGEIDDEIDSTRYLSRGENKMLFFSLIESCAKYIETETKRPALYLFDDVFAELDPENSKKILSKHKLHIATSQTPFTHDQDRCLQI